MGATAGFSATPSRSAMHAGKSRAGWARVPDIDERKRFEEERERLLAAERVARTEAEHASRMKDEFLATLSHELRTPLNAILGWISHFQGAGSRRGELQEGLDVIERNARVQKQLIEDLLDMSRIISGKSVSTCRGPDFARSSASAGRRPPVRGGQRRSAAGNARPAACPLVRGDPARLQQVVWNLLSNAIKFTPRGGHVQSRSARGRHHTSRSMSRTPASASARISAVHFRAFPAGRLLDDPTLRRLGTWTGHRQKSRRIARRRGAGEKRGA